MKVTISLQQEIRSIKLDPEFLKEETAVVEEAVTEAVREAIAQSKKMNDEAVQKITQSLQVPGMPSLF